MYKNKNGFKIYYQKNRKDLLKKKKEYRKIHEEEIKIYQKEYRKNHKKDIKEFRKNNKEKINKYLHNKLKTNINFKLSRSLRTRLNSAIKDNQKSGSAVRDLGCSIPELKAYLESKWKEGMTWENWGRTGWHIDHIIPLDFFNLQNREEFLKACHYTNLQPLWAEENYQKAGLYGVTESHV